MASSSHQLRNTHFFSSRSTSQSAVVMKCLAKQFTERKRTTFAWCLVTVAFDAAISAVTVAITVAAAVVLAAVVRTVAVTVAVVLG